MTNTRTLDAYVRVSRVGGREGDSFMSPELQREAIERWAEANNAVIADWHTDLDVSGAKASRPGLDALLARIASGKTGGMVVAKLDRASRKASDGLILIKGIVDKGAEFVTANGQVDATTKDGRMMLTILLAIAEWEWEGRREGWATVTAAVNARGVHQGSVIGYEREEGQPLKLIPAAKPIITKAFEMRASNASWSTIVSYLNASDLKPPRAASWSINSVRSMIANGAYLGTAKQGEHICENAHEAMVSRDLFAAANAVKGSAHARTTDHLLSGLCRCQGCRYRMAGQVDKRGESYRTYRCRGQRGCESPANVKASAIEAYVIAEAFKAHDVLITSTHKSLDIEALNAAVAEADAKAQAFALKVDPTSDYFAAGMAAREDGVREAREARDNALATFAPEGVSLSHKLSEDWDGMTADERRSALKGLIDFIVVHRDKSVAIVWRGQSRTLGAVPTTGSGQKAEDTHEVRPFAWPILSADGEAPTSLA